MNIAEFRPKLPKRIEQDSLDTSFEFALKNFPGWWETMSALNFNEIEILTYVQHLRNTISTEESPEPVCFGE